MSLYLIFVLLLLSAGSASALVLLAMDVVVLSGVELFKAAIILMLIVLASTFGLGAATVRYALKETP